MTANPPVPTLAVLTPGGRGAVATLRVTGLDRIDEVPPLFNAANGRPLAEQPIDRICFGRWGLEAAEEVVICRVADDTAEIHCHGGDAAVARIVADLRGRGCVQQSAVESSSADVADVEQECRQALARATTMRCADILWQQCEGRLAQALGALDQMPADRAARAADAMLAWADFGRHLTQPWQVVLCGRPNVGKSSLINALVGYGRSIVFDQPGTTRDVVTAETAMAGWAIEFSDTAGLRDDADALESAGIVLARQRLATADLRVLLLDISRPPHEDDRRLQEEWPDALIVAHKSDLDCAWTDVPASAIRVSSVTQSGIDELAAAIVARLVPDVPPPMTLLPVTSRQVEWLRKIAAG